MGQRLRAEVAATERLDSRLLQRLSQRSEGVGQDNGDASTEVSSIGDLSFDESVSSRLQVNGYIIILITLFSYLMYQIRLFKMTSPFMSPLELIAIDLSL